MSEEKEERVVLSLPDKYEGIDEEYALACYDLELYQEHLEENPPKTVWEWCKAQAWVAIKQEKITARKQHLLEVDQAELDEYLRSVEDE